MSRAGQKTKAARAFWAGILVLCGCLPARGAFESYVPAYNELVLMATSRCEVAGIDYSSIAPKPPESALAFVDIVTLWSLTKQIRKTFISYPPDELGPFDITAASALEAFPPLGDVGPDRLTIVPSDFTASGNALNEVNFSGNYSRVPVMWTHLESIHEALLEAKYTVHGGGTPPRNLNTGWTHLGLTGNVVSGSGGGNHVGWGDAKTEAGLAFAPGSPTSPDRWPERYSMGKWDKNLFPGGYRASLYSGSARFYVDGLAEFPKKVRFYNYARAMPLQYGVVREAVFANDAGLPVTENAWTAWGPLVETASGSYVESEVLGIASAYNPPPWCHQPPKGDATTMTSLGMSADFGAAVIEWTGLYSPQIRRPSDRKDSEADGLVVLDDCECRGECRPEYSISRSSGGIEHDVRFPLGHSSGLQSGGVAVNAYVTEFHDAGKVRQMFSLNTSASGYIDTGGAYEFVLIRRPSGVEVLLSLKGGRAGFPVDGAYSYRASSAGGAYELHFEQDRVVHRFEGGTAPVPVSEVRVGKGSGEPVSVRLVRTTAFDNAYVQAPGLRVVQNRYDNRFVKSVASVLFQSAVPRYTAGLIHAVEYRDIAGNPAGRLTVNNGSRIFAVEDAFGEELKKTKIISAPGRSERWDYGSSDNPVRREISEEYFPAADGDLRVVTNTVMLHAGEPAETRSHTAEIFKMFPWGEELVRELVGAGSPASSSTEFSYHTNTADTANFGRLALVERPDGSWTRYTYDREGRIAQVVEPFGDAGPAAETNACRVIHYVYAGDPRLAELNVPEADSEQYNDRRPRLTIETALGREISRTYEIFMTDRHEVRRCRVPGAAWDAPQNLARVTYYETGGMFRGRPAAVLHENGTCSRYAYSYQASGDLLTITRQSGAGSISAITNGLESVTVLDNAGRIRSSREADIASGILLRDIRYERDVFGRSVVTSNAVNGSVFSAVYGCCGIEQMQDQGGLVTERTTTIDGQPESLTRNGVTEYLSYDAHGNVQERRLGVPGDVDIVTTHNYDGAGRLIQSRDPLGAVTSFSYGFTTGGGPSESVWLPGGGEYTEEYARDGRLRLIRGSAAYPRCYAYGAGPAGDTWVTEFRGDTMSASEWVTTSYDMLGNVTNILFADGYTVRIAYDGYGREKTRTDGYSTMLSHYDDQGRIFRTGVDMDGNGRLDPVGPDRIRETVYRFGAMDGIVAAETVHYAYHDPASGTPMEVSRVLRSLDGRQQWHIQQGRTNSLTITWNRESGSRVETLVRPDGTRLQANYVNGLRVAETRLDSKSEPVSEAHYTYDAFNRLASVSDRVANGAERIVYYAYDAAGQLTNRTVVAEGLARSYSYSRDPRGRAVRITVPGGGVVTNRFSVRGELLEQSGTHVRPMQYTYDSLGRVASLATFAGGLAGNPDLTHWNYDSRRGFLRAKVYADGSTNRFLYYGDGSLRQRLSARGIATDYAYDPAGQLEKVAYSDGTPAVTYGRDRLGRSVQVLDAAGEHRYAYSREGWLRAVAGPQMPGLGYAYDALGRITNITVSAESGTSRHAVLRTYDAAGRIDRVEGRGLSARYLYGCDGVTVTNMQLGADMQISSTYDGHNRLTAFMAGAGSRILQAGGYAYDASNLCRRQALDDGSFWEYTYDALGHLDGAMRFHPGGIPVGGSRLAFTYDSAGNRASAANLRGQRTRTSLYHANSLNQYTERTVPDEVFVTGRADEFARVTISREGDARSHLANRHRSYFWQALTAPNDAAPAVFTNIAIRAVSNAWIRTESRTALVPQSPENFRYDADGNLLEDGLWQYAWNAENRITNITSRSSVPDAFRRRLDFIYDHRGRRVRKVVQAWKNGGWEQAAEHGYLYDGWNVLLETGNAEQGAFTNAYVWGLDVSHSLQGAAGVGGLVGVAGPAGDCYAFGDGRGNITGYFRQNGVCAASRKYAPYGAAISETGENVSAFSHWHASRLLDAETGLYAYPLRHYSPVTGRWLSRDPIGEAGGHNLYEFAGGNPIAYSDPLGLALYAFDGTGTRYETWTHVSILHRSYEGVAWYLDGVGSRWYSSVVGGMTGLGGRNRLERMYNLLVDTYESGDQDIDIIGFSRGAALAREFANMIYERGIRREQMLSPSHSHSKRSSRRKASYDVIACDPKIRFVGVFDTVGSFGVAGNHINPGIRMDLPPNVRHAAQAVAYDERRKVFPLTPLSKPGPGQHFSEALFKGDHSDVGGGHTEDQNLLALQPLTYIWSEGRAAGVPFGPLNLVWEDGLFLEVSGSRRPWGYQAGTTPHDLTARAIYADGGRRENLPEGITW